jgi:azurin
VIATPIQISKKKKKKTVTVCAIGASSRDKKLFFQEEIQVSEIGTKLNVTINGEQIAGTRFLISKHLPFKKFVPQVQS